MFKLSANSINNLAGVDGRLIDIADLAITLSNIDFGIPSTGGLRTEAVQAKLFADGVSKQMVLTTSPITNQERRSMCMLTLTEKPRGTSYIFLS